MFFEVKSYDAFGSVRNETPSGDIRNNNQFMGAYGIVEDEEDGLTFVRARYYDEEIGRFISREILGTYPSYMYCKNNPVTSYDKNGQYGEDVHLKATNRMALDVGFDSETARHIATMNQSVDTNLTTHPILAGATGQSGVLKDWHFSDRGDVEKRLAFELEHGDIDSFSQTLHTLQDTFSHERQIAAGETSHGFGDYDKYDPSRRAIDREMIRQTKYWLKKLLDDMKKNPCKYKKK